ncbi:MAG: AAA family ATPase [Acidobacteriota bacterium]|nr:AAA family ATPase [Acidobacteriota bacterium]
MLSLLKIKNIALIDEIELEFANGLNLLTGETGSGKSIIVDSLGALTGDRVSSDLIKEGAGGAQIEGLFNVFADENLRAMFETSGIELEEKGEIDLIVRRELATSGRNRIFVNNQIRIEFSGICGRFTDGASGEFLFYKRGRKIDWKDANLAEKFPPDAHFSNGKWLKPLPK